MGFMALETIEKRVAFGDNKAADRLTAQTMLPLAAAAPKKAG
jgi:hypothetical protein